MINMVITALILYTLFFFACYWGTGTDEKNLRNFYSYPIEVRESLRKNEKFKNQIPEKQPTYRVFAGNLLLFSFLFSAIGIILKLSSFEKTFLFLLMLGEGLNLFDFLVIDMLWWRNTKRIRFSVLPEKEKYQSLVEHRLAFLKGLPLFVAVAVLAARTVSIIMK